MSQYAIRLDDGRYEYGTSEDDIYTPLGIASDYDSARLAFTSHGLPPMAETVPIPPPPPRDTPEWDAWVVAIRNRSVAA